ncbi:MAG TPA: hypothetical protein VFZ65_16525 [Planctomycetota bacterium]|nr:hypothetical protein [Planctomycetota bacterium]
MNHSPLRVPLQLAVISCALTAVGAQEQRVRFVPTAPMVRMAVHDLPALLAALPGTRFGQLFAEADVADAFAAGQRVYAERREHWARAFDALSALAPDSLTVEDLAEREGLALDWRELHSGAIVASRPEGAQMFEIQATCLLEPIAAAEPGWTQHFEALAEKVAKMADPHAAAGPAQSIDGFPAFVIGPGERRQEQDFGGVPGTWLLHVPGQFGGGSGVPADAGHCRPCADPAPGLVLELDVLSYARMILRVVGESEFSSIIEALGFDGVGLLSWHVHPAGDLLQEDLALEFDARPKGVLGALVDGMAPLVEQPVPEQTMLQIRCGFDVRALLRAIGTPLEQAGMPALASFEEDLDKACTGGIAFAIARPAPGGLVPRLFASIGIADETALARVLAKLLADAEIKTKEVTYEGQPCVQLRIDGLPAGLQPCYCVHRGVLHFAESGQSLRALLKAAAAGAPPALDVGDAPRPEGAGAMLPGFDLRFDGAAIHSTMQELWLPLWTKLMGDDVSTKPLVPLEDMPPVRVVTGHLTKGRGVLRRQPKRLVLSMSGTAGGPELHALLTLYGPLLSGSMTSSWHWRAQQFEEALARAELAKIHAAIVAFTQRTGAAPRSLGELLAGPEITDKGLLLVEGDDLAEPVLHDGVEVAKTSFRYYPEGIKVSPQGEEVTVQLIMIKALAWQRLAADKDGTVHEGYGDFATRTIDELTGVRPVHGAGKAP